MLILKIRRLLRSKVIIYIYIYIYIEREREREREREYLLFGLRYGFHPQATDVMSRTSEVRTVDIISCKSGVEKHITKTTMRLLHFNPNKLSSCALCYIYIQPYLPKKLYKYKYKMYVKQLLRKMNIHALFIMVSYSLALIS